MVVSRWREIIAVIPIYHEQGGNATEVWFQNGESIILNYKISTFLREVAKIFAVDLVQLRKNYGELVGRQNNVPLIFHQQLVMVPMKMRSPMIKNDGAMGYVVHHHIGRVAELDKHQVRVHFINGKTIDGLQSFRSFSLLVKQSNMLLHEHLSLISN